MQYDEVAKRIHIKIFIQLNHSLVKQKKTCASWSLIHDLTHILRTFAMLEFLYLIMENAECDRSMAKR